MRQRSAHRPIFDKRKRTGQIVVGNTPGEPIIELVVADATSASTADNVELVTIMVPNGPWETFYSTALPDFLALGYANADLVTNFPDEIGVVVGADMTAAQSSATRAVIITPDASFNGHASIDSGGGTRGLRSSVGGNVAGPRTVFVIGKFNVTTTGTVMVDYDGSGGRYSLLTSATGYSFTNGAGGTISGGTKDTSPHCFVMYGNGASSKLLVDGTQVATGTVTGNEWGGVGFARDVFNSYHNVTMVAYGTILGDLTTDDPGLWADFKTWVEDTYGIAQA